VPKIEFCLSILPVRSYAIPLLLKCVVHTNAELLESPNVANEARSQPGHCLSTFLSPD